uniref:Uncharacterized protein n=1 Tax=Brassica oleracea TaxID=3712 RepID=A0A3P6DHY6_BRAOL|nr:unnamed protein product [Brassica oleracea]
MPRLTRMFADVIRPNFHLTRPVGLIEPEKMSCLSLCSFIEGFFLSGLEYNSLANVTASPSPSLPPTVFHSFHSTAFTFLTSPP